MLVRPSLLGSVCLVLIFIEVRRHPTPFDGSAPPVEINIADQVTVDASDLRVFTNIGLTTGRPYFEVVPKEALRLPDRCRTAADF